MNISVYLEAPLVEQTAYYAQKMGMTRNAIIRAALKLWLDQYQKPAWPESVLAFRGDKDWVPFEKGREDLSSVDEDPLA